MRNNKKMTLDSPRKVLHARNSPRTKFPLRETLNNFLESFDYFIHARSLRGVILDHVVKEWFYEFKTFFVATNFANEWVSLRTNVKRVQEKMMIILPVWIQSEWDYQRSKCRSCMGHELAVVSKTLERSCRRRLDSPLQVTRHLGHIEMTFQSRL